MAIDTIKSSAVLDGAIATADIADDAVTSAKLDTNISVDGNLGLGTSVSTRKLNVNAGSYGHMLLDTANAAHGIQILGQANAAANSGFDIQYAASTGLKVRTLAVQPLSLQTSASAGSPSDRLHIHTSGVVSIPQGIELGSGVDATAANTLDDYEEGSFTPTVAGLSLTAATGHYVKVGKVVHFGFSIQVPSNSASTHFKINNPPFTPFSPGGAGNNFGGSLNFSNANLASVGITCIVTTGNDIQFYKNGAAFATHADFSNGTMVASGAYLTDA